MYRFMILSVLAATLLFLGACSNSGGATTTDETPVDATVPDMLIGENDTAQPDADPIPATEVTYTPGAHYKLAIAVDVTKWEEMIFPTKSTISFVAEADFNTLVLFGEAFNFKKASCPYQYDGHTVKLYCGEFKKNDAVSVSAEYESTMPSPNFGLKVWSQGGDDFMVGPFTEPYNAPLWVLSPQSLHNIDKNFDYSLPLDEVTLSVTVPSEEWVVVGPGVNGKRTGNTVNFEMKQPMPLYALSFAASPRYTLFQAGTSTSGKEVWGAGFASEVETLKEVYKAGITTIDWMEEHIGPHDFGSLGFVSVPDFGGGMEHVGVIYMGTDVLAKPDSAVFVTVHEAVHNWWGNNVRFADWPHFWLAEGFNEWTTNYNLMGAIEDEEAFAQRRADYRYGGAFLCAMEDAWPLRFKDGRDLLDSGMQLQMFYYYGAAFLEMVNRRMIDRYKDNLLEYIQAWYLLKRHTSATTEEFLAFLEEQTEDDEKYWVTLFNEWVYDAPCPNIEAGSYSYQNGKVSFILKRLAAGHGMTQLPIEAVYAGGSVTTTVDFPKESQSITVELDLPSEPSQLLIDPEWNYVFLLATEKSWKGPKVSFTRNADAASELKAFERPQQFSAGY